MSFEEWNSILKTEGNQHTPLSDDRFSLDMSEEEVWIPSDQTLHWGKRPCYTYPAIKIERKEEIPSIPRGTRLCSRLWLCQWMWDDVDPTSFTSSEQKVENEVRLKQRWDPNTHSCLHDEKVMIPFEKGSAVFRHLRVDKSIKLKKAETFTITALGFEIGYHNPFNKNAFTSLDIFLTKQVKIHIVAHKGSVKLLQKHGLLPLSIPNVSTNEPIPIGRPNVPPIAIPVPSTQTSTDSISIPPTNLTLNPFIESLPSINSPPSDDVLAADELMAEVQQKHFRLLESFQLTANSLHINPVHETGGLPLSNPSVSPMITETKMEISSSSSDKSETNEIITLKRKFKSNSEPTDIVEVHKKLKTAQLVEIMDELTEMQKSIDALKRKVIDFIQHPDPPLFPKTYTKVVKPNDTNPMYFTFYAFRTHNLDLAMALMKAFPFDINDKNTAGMSLIHVAVRHAFYDGVQYCIQHGGAVNMPNDQKNSALHMAYLRNDKSIRKLLKQSNADREALNLYGLKPKDYRHNRRPLIRAIPQIATCVEVVIEGFSRPFFLEIWSAARLGWIDVVKLYIDELHCDVDIKSSNGQTPLMCACEHKKEDMVRFLLSIGAEANARDCLDFSVLHYAYMSGFQKVIDLLEKQYNADTDVRDIWGRPPSWYKRE